MRVFRNGIYKTIDNNLWGIYQQQGWKKMGSSEPQPSQEGLYVIDDYTIGCVDKK